MYVASRWKALTSQATISPEEVHSFPPYVQQAPGPQSIYEVLGPMFFLFGKTAVDSWRGSEPPGCPTRDLTTAFPCRHYQSISQRWKLRSGEVSRQPRPKVHEHWLLGTALDLNFCDNPTHHFLCCQRQLGPHPPSHTWLHPAALGSQDGPECASEMLVAPDRICKPKGLVLPPN